MRCFPVYFSITDAISRSVESLDEFDGKRTLYYVQVRGKEEKSSPLRT